MSNLSNFSTCGFICEAWQANLRLSQDWETFLTPLQKMKPVIVRKTRMQTLQHMLLFSCAYFADALWWLFRETVNSHAFFFHLHPDPPRQQAVLNCDYPQEPVYTLLYFKWITNRVLLCSIGNTAQCYMAAWMGGEFGGNGYMCMYGRVPLLSTWNYHTVNQLYTNIKKSWKNIF